MEDKILKVYVNSSGQKIKTSGLTISQNSTNNVLTLITVGQYSSVTATFKLPDGNLSDVYHMTYAGAYTMTSEDAEYKALSDNSNNLYKYDLTIPFKVTSSNVLGASSRLNVSFAGFGYDDNQFLLQSMTANTQITVNQASTSQTLDESYSAADVENLWKAVGIAAQGGGGGGSVPTPVANRYLHTNGSALMEWSELTKASVGLGNVNNTADMNKPVSVYQQAAIDTKEDLITGAEKDALDSGITSAKVATYDGYASTIATKANITDVPTKTSQLTNDSTFQTLAQLNTALASKEDLLTGNKLNAVTSGITAAKVATYDGYASSKANVSDIPTKVSDLTNDSNFLTATQVSAAVALKQDALSVSQLAATNSGITTTTVGQISTNASDIATINTKIPAQATSSNQLADKAFVNSSIQNMAARFITKNATGDPFATRAQLLSATTFYYNGSVTTLNNNDYTIVTQDEQHDNQQSRYIYVKAGSTGVWNFQYKVGSSFTAQQQASIDSGITSALVTKYNGYEATINSKASASDIPTAVSLLTNDSGYQTAQDVSTAVSTKQNTLTTEQLAAANSGITANKVTTYDGYASAIASKADASAIPTKVSDLTNDSGFQTASDVTTAISGKQNTIVGAQLSALNSGITATKVGQYDLYDIDKQDKLIGSGAGQNIKTINGLSLLGSGDIAITPGSAAIWGSITGSIENLDDLQGALSAKASVTYVDSGLATKQNTIDASHKISYNYISDTPTIPTKTSELTNDSGFLTEHQSLANYSTTTQMNAAIAAYHDSTKLDVISDLATIRSNASTAVTEVGIINGKIPSAATTENQLADKAFVNSSIQSAAANYVTSDASGNSFATRAALLAGPYYHNGEAYTPKNNDYAMVEADETHDNKTSRYSYSGSSWSYLYSINATFTQAQQNALDSGITADKVSIYDGYASTIAAKANTTDITNGTITALNATNATTATNYAVGGGIATALAGKQNSLPTVVNGYYLHANSSTGALEWAAAGGGSFAELTGQPTDNTNLATALAAKQNKLYSYVLGPND